MKDNSTNTAVEMTTEEFHRLLEENTKLLNAERTHHQNALAYAQNVYTESIDAIIQDEKLALETFRLARDEFETAKREYDDMVRRCAKRRNEAGQRYNREKADAKSLWCLNNNRLQSERHNLFERFRDSGGQIVGDMAGLLHPGWTKREKKGVSDETEA